MPAPRIHEKIDFEAFGEIYPEVHKWIDGTFDGKNGRVHWVNRHYVMIVLQKFNPKDFPDKEKRERLIAVAKLHILLDWIWYYKQIVLPQTHQDVIEELAKNGVLME